MRYPLMFVIGASIAVAGCDTSPSAGFLASDVHVIGLSYGRTSPEHATGVTVQEFYDAVLEPKSWEKTGEDTYVLHSRPQPAGFIKARDNSYTITKINEAGATFARVTAVSDNGRPLDPLSVSGAAIAIVGPAQMKHIKSALN